LTKKSGKGCQKTPSGDTLISRINCFGEFDRRDQVCLKRCALSILCAIAKNPEHAPGQSGIKREGSD